MITWAIARAGIEFDDFVVKFPQVKDWLDKSKKPTVKQLESFSHSVHIPFGYLFLDNPPKETVPFPFFRTGKSPKEQPSINIYDTILIIQRRQDWLTEYLRDNDFEPLNFVEKFNVNSSYETIVNDIRTTLNLDKEWAKDFNTIDDTLNFITSRIEEQRIIVSFNSVVENNTHRPILVEECRGFVLVNEMAPFLYVNAGDAKAAQLFTIVHELAHIWLGSSAGFDNNKLLPADDPTELLCDKVAAEFLVPEVTFNKLWQGNPDIYYISKRFKVSPIVIARRALDLRAINKDSFFSFYNEYIQRLNERKESQSSGGDFYATAKKRVSVSFATFVNNAVKQEKLLYRDAFKMTGLKGDTYQNFVNKHLF